MPVEDSIKRLEKEIRNHGRQPAPEHSCNVRECMVALTGAQGIGYRTSSMQNASTQQTSAQFHYSQEEKELRAAQNRALKVMVKGFAELTTEDKTGFLRNHFIPNLSHLLVSKDPADDAQLNSFAVLERMILKMPPGSDTEVLKALADFATVLRGMSDFRHDDVGTGLKIARGAVAGAKLVGGWATLIPSAVLTSFTPGKYRDADGLTNSHWTNSLGWSMAIKGVERASSRKGINVGVDLLLRHIELRLPALADTTAFPEPEYEKLRGALQDLARELQDRPVLEQEQGLENYGAAVELKEGRSLLRLETMIDRLEETRPRNTPPVPDNGI